MYKREYLNEFHGRWICAPDAFLRSFDKVKTEEFPEAPFIWSRRYVRAYFRRVFCLDTLPREAFLHLRCDNVFDVFLNGKQLCTSVCDTGHLDISGALEQGENLLMIRAFQTARPESFSSALTGGMCFTLSDGTALRILTDEAFENVRFIDFHERQEPEGWMLDKTSNREVNNQLIVSDMHPLAVKRSCYFAKDFPVSKPVRKAELKVSAMGCSEPHLNGQWVGHAYLLASICKEKEYHSFDVTGMLQQGQNRLSVQLGNGWYNCESWGNLLVQKPAVYMELEIEYADDSREYLATDDTWQVCASPLTDNDLQFGERYDARLEVEGWDLPGCAQGLWHPAEALEQPFDRLLKQNYPPIRGTDHPVTYVGKLPDGSGLFDCGRNLAGAAELTLRNTYPGQQVQIRVCERLDAQGLPVQDNYMPVYFIQDAFADGKAPYNCRNINVYYAKGAQEEHYAPKFCYTGFRYVYIKGAEVAAEDVTVRQMHNDLQAAGDFVSSDPFLTRIFDATRLTWLNNCFNGPTDCPTREKNFWTGDMMLFSHMACWLTDNGAFLSRWTDLGRKMTGPYGYEDETYMLPWTLYRFYADPGILECSYEKIRALVEQRIATNQGGVLPVDPYSCYNDWMSPTNVNLSSEFFSHCWYLRMLDICSQIAALLGRGEDAQNWRSAYNAGKKLFQEKHFDPQVGNYRENIQAAAVLPLAYGLVPQQHQQQVAEALHKLLVQNDHRLNTGFFGTRHLLEVLCDHGYGQDALKLICQQQFPSWRGMLDTGATNITESWLGLGDPDGMISMCHFSMAAAFCWLFEYLGGIRVLECAPGFTRVVLEPHCFEAFGDCSVSYRCSQGLIRSAWRFVNGELKWEYSVPDGVEVEVRQPHVYKKQNNMDI